MGEMPVVTLTNGVAIPVAGYSKLAVQFQVRTSCVFWGSDHPTGDNWYVLEPNKDEAGGPNTSRIYEANQQARFDILGAERVKVEGLAAPVSASFNLVFNPFDSARPAYRIATIGGLGDSGLQSGVVTSAGNDQQNLATGRLGVLNQHNVQFWASGYSRGRLAYAGSAGLAGLTSTQVLTDHLAVAQARRWTFCPVHVGTNDIGVLAASVTIANVRQMVEGLLAVGTIPIICGVLPHRVTTGTAYDQLNEGLRRLAVEYRVPFEDNWGPNVGVDGLGSAALFRDNAHLTHAANQARGERLAALILGAYPELPANLLPWSNAADKAGLFPNPIFNQNSGAVTPTGWAISGAGATSNVAGGTVGNTFALTRAAANAVANTSSAFATAGGTYLWVGGIQTSGSAFNGSTYFGFRDPGSLPQFHAWQMSVNSVDLPANFEPAVLFSVPAGFPANRFQHQNAGNSSSVVTLQRNELYAVGAWI